MTQATHRIDTTPIAKKLQRINRMTHQWVMGHLVAI